MFDLNIGVVRAKLLTDTAQGDGYAVHKDRPDFVKKAINILGSQVGDTTSYLETNLCLSSKKKLIYFLTTMQCHANNKLWKSSGRRLGETPMKMLIAQELSTAIELKEKTPSVVAKLMGLNSLPIQPKILACKRNIQETDSLQRTSRGFQNHQQKEEDSFTKMKNRNDLHIHDKKYEDVYDVKLQHSSNDQLVTEKLLHGDSNGNLTEKRMALVHQKFIEAKRLATNEKFLQSKEFKDALEVLNSNKDLFLKLLEDPNSLFSNQLEEVQHTSLAGTQAKCITVLKPTPSIDIDNERCRRKNQYAFGEEIRDVNEPELSSSFFLPKAEVVSQPTRIVVLKANSAISREAQTNLASDVSLPVPESRITYENLKTDGDERSSKVDNKFIHKLQKSSSLHNDEYQRTSVLSNGYVADESSLGRSPTDYRKGSSDCSDSDLMALCSHWVHLRSGSTGSLSSFGHGSYSLESPVSAEAKKRLSERWESVTSNDVNHEQAYFRKSSSTLGEMLAIPEVKKEEEEADKLATSSCVTCSEGQCMSMTSICSTSNRMQENEQSPKNFARSKSLPASACFESIRMSEKISRARSSKSSLLNQVPKMKNEKSFKDKVSGLFFSGMKKLVMVSPTLSPSSPDDRFQSSISLAERIDNFPKFLLDRISDKHPPKTLEAKSTTFSSPISISSAERNGKAPLKGIRSIEKLWKSEISRENLNQPNHSSTFERSFHEDFLPNFSHSSSRVITGNPQEVCRSPLISSVRRSLSSERAQPDSPAASSSSSSKLFKLFSREDEERERADFVAKLLSSSGFADEGCCCCSASMLLSKSHSLESPLDPVFLCEFLGREGEEEEAKKRREKRSNQKLYFDCANIALKSIISSALADASPWPSKPSKANQTVADAVRRRLKDWFSEDDDDEQCGKRRWPCVDSMARKEAAGLADSSLLWLQMDELSGEVCERLLEELLQDTLSLLC